MASNLHVTAKNGKKLMNTAIKVFYSNKMIAKTKSFSPSAEKPALVVSSWMKLDQSHRIKIVEPNAVTVDQLNLAHSTEYVEGILSMKIRNGFRNFDQSVADSLPYTSGAMLSAAREALKNRRVAVAPCSGFHHAKWNTADGFCTFNGLMVTAMALKNEGLVSRVGIIDFDMHIGDGTDQIIQQLSINWIRHFSAGYQYEKPEHANNFFHAIPWIIDMMKGCDLILYQAGADPHIDDPLGGFLTTEQLKERDRLVFEHVSNLKIPVVWNLAGGYQDDFQKVIEVHDNTMRSCIDVYSSL